MSQEIMEAMKRREGGQAPNPALNQAPPTVGLSQPMPAPTPAGDMTQASGPSGPPTPEAPTMPKFEPQDRQDLITVALIEQLKKRGKDKNESY